MFFFTNNIWSEHKIQTILNVLSDLIHEVLKQIILESLVQFFTSRKCKECPLPTRGLPRSTVLSEYCTTVVKLLNLYLILQNLKMTKTEVKSIVDIISLLYVDNKTVLSLAFFEKRQILILA